LKVLEFHYQNIVGTLLFTLVYGYDTICRDFKCVQKPTKSRISQTLQTSTVIEQNINVKWPGSP